MKWIRGWRAFVLLSLCIAGFAHAQQVPTWSARRMLAETNSPEIHLVSQGAKVDQVSRESVARAVDVTERLAAAFEMPAPEIVVTRQNGPNAFATLNAQGQAVMGINTDMLRLAGQNDAMLATVVGHELAHLKARHVSDGRQRAAVVTVLGALLGAAVDVSQARRGHGTGGLGTLLGGVGANLVNAKFSRDQEREADDLGVRAMARAGFDPSVAARMWQVLAQRRAGGAGAWFDSHPSHPEREQAMAAAAQELRPVYLANASPAAAHGAPLAAAAPVDDPYPRSAHASYLPGAEEVAAGTAYARAHAEVAARRFAQAESLLQDAALAGDERALGLLGELNASGHLRAADPAAAGYYYQRAAAKGFGPALRGLALLALDGRGRTQDDAEAVRLLRLAHARDDLRATATLGLLSLQGQAVARNLAQARSLAEHAAAGGDALGKALLGAMLRDGDGGPAEPEKGVALLSEAAPAVPWAKYQLGIAYERGLGTEQDPGKAAAAYEEAAAAGVAGAQSRLKALVGR